MNFFSKNKNLKMAQYINKKDYLKRLFQFLIGCLILSIAYNIFIAPNNLVPGGVGGIAIIVGKFFNIDNSYFILIMNIILLISSLVLLGKEKTRATILGAILFPLFIKLTEDINVWVQMDTTQLLLSSIFGGIIYGFGAGLIFKAGFTTGGTDIINQILSKYFKISIGKSMLFSDGIIVLSSGIFFGINSMMYSLLILYITSLISDRVILGISESKLFLIITEKDDEVKDYIMKYMGHGVTIMKARGGYKKGTENVLMTVLPTKDYYQLKEGIEAIDKDVFYIIADTYEVFGGE